MPHRFRSSPWFALFAVVLLPAAIAHADCPCKRGGGGFAGGPAPLTGYGAMPMPMPEPHYSPMAVHDMAGSMMAAPMMMFGYGAAVPPGTLGQTYQRRSEPIDPKDHPRTGKVRVRAPLESDVTAAGMKAKWIDGAWILETTEPLIPGSPHIIAVQVSPPGSNGQFATTRYVRLIMGRVVDLD